MTTAAINSALSSIFAIQKQMNLASANIANADVDGYTAKSVKLNTTVSGGIASGVATSAASSTVDRYLLKDIAAAVSSASEADTADTYYEALQQLLGSVSSDDAGSGSDLSSLLSNLTDAASDLAGTPDSESYKAAFVAALDDVAAALRRTSAEVQELRSQADQEIAETVDEVNAALDQIAALNLQIRSAQASGESTADLEDQRMSALQAVAKNIDVNYFVDQYGNMQIYTAGNQILLDRSGARHLDHTASSLSDSVSYAGGGIDAITLNGVDITNAIGTGSLAALVEQRDSVLTNVQSELDNLSQSLAATVNAIFNGGTANPPPATLEGTMEVDSGTTISVASGTTLRIAVTDAEGKALSVTDLDLSGAATIGDVVSALSTVSGVTASLVDGHLKIEVSGDQGIAVSTISGSLDGEDASAYFGFNDVLIDGASASTIAVRSELLASPGTLPSGTLSSSLSVGETAVGAADATVASALSEALSGKTSFAAAGWLGSSKQSFGDYAASIVSSVTSRAEAASDEATSLDSALSTLQSRFSDESGVNVDSETAKLAELQNAYAASAQIISTVQSMFDSLLNAVQG
jgi:flagellar hook-associated protein 1 FlgK